MRTLLPAVATALAQKRVVATQLIFMDLASGPLYMNTSSWTFHWQGVDWLPVFAIGSIDPINDQGTELAALGFKLSGVYLSNRELVLTEPVKGRRVEIRTAIHDDLCQIIDAPIEWAGKLDYMNISQQGKSSTINVSAEHFGINFLRASNRRMSHQDQTRAFPGDNFFDKLIATADQVITWPAASFYAK